MHLSRKAILFFSSLTLLVHGQLIWSSHSNRKDSSGRHGPPSSPRPVVFYHGMGDSAHSRGMEELFESVRTLAPTIYIHSVQLMETESADQNAGFFGNVNKQIETVCKQLKENPKLKDGFNAVGFSQGGQFLRAYVQRCNDPPIHNLITFGSQHAGVSDIPGCLNEDASCRLMRTIVKAGVYSSYVQNRVVQAQYYKDPHNIPLYMERNIFLPFINNELAFKNETYASNLNKLNTLVMFLFEQDITVKPKETAWFAFEDENGNIIDLEDQELYTKDWLGLKTMNENDKLIFEILEGEHMQFSLEEFAEKVTIPYLLELNEPGPTTKAKNTRNRQRVKQLRQLQHQEQSEERQRTKGNRFKLQIIHDDKY